MNLTDVFSLQRRTGWRETIAGRPWRLAIRVWAGSAVLLMLYCVLHNTFTGAKPMLGLSVVWSLGHASGFVCLMMLTARSAWREWLRLLLPLLAALLVSFLVGASGQLVGMSDAVIHGLVSITVYGITGLFFWFFWNHPRVDAVIWLDIKQERRAVPVNRIHAIHGARNYLELEIAGEASVGLLRMSMADFRQQYNDAFLQVHRSHCVAPASVASVKQSPRRQPVLVLVNGTEVPVGEKYLASLRSVPQLVPALADLSL